MGADCTIKLSLGEAVPVISVSGELTAEAEEEFLNTYASIPEDSRKRVVVDFTDTRYINSAGIAVLINVITRASDLDHKVEFCGLNLHLKRVIDIVGLADHVQIHDTLNSALLA